jgi:hypothetical protein
VSIKDDFRLNDFLAEAIIWNPFSLNGSSTGLLKLGSNRIPLLFLISYNSFKVLVSSFISSIINDGEIAGAEAINDLSLGYVMNAL